jgi:2-haloacid dehalogenase
VGARRTGAAPALSGKRAVERGDIMSTLRQPKIVVFDVGNVLVDWDPRHLYRKVFPDPARMEWFLSEVCHPQWNLAQDAGRPWPEAEAEAIARHPEMATEIRAFRARWPEMISGPITGTVAILEQLAASGTPLYAITNFAADTFAETTERFPFFHHFRGIVVSAAEKMLKPDPWIYRLLESRYGLDLADCVFIDDSAKNCAGARAVGMHAIDFVGPEDARNRLTQLGLPVPASA